MFFQVRDVIKYSFLFLLFIPLTGKAQSGHDSLLLRLPDTSLSIQNTLFYIEDSAGVYFSYNPGIFSGDSAVEWSNGSYSLSEILDRISGIGDVQYARVGNQVVFYREGEEIPDQSARLEEKPVFMRITGRITDAEGKNPLSYSTVWLPLTWEGSIANAEGYFSLSIAEEHIDDTLAFSCMGYQSRRIPIRELGDSVNTIRLEPSLIPIQEVVIRRTNPIYILRLALSKIPENNSKKPVLETAFYRESIRKNGNFVSVSEAVVEIYKPGYASLSAEQVKLLRGRQNIDYSQADTLLVKIKAGLSTSFLLDIIRNRPDFLIEERFVKYEYRMSDIVVIQDNMAYAIDFNQKEGTDPPHYRGRIYIDLESYALRAIEFEVDPNTINQVAASMVLRKPRKVKVRPISAEYQVQYKEEGGLYHVSLIRADNRFRIRPRKKVFGNEYRTTSEMAVTGLDTDNVDRFRIREIVNPNNIFMDMMGGYDPSFWGPYNYLIPEESLEQALIRIGRLMETRAPAD